MNTNGYVASSPGSTLRRFSFERRDPGPLDVQMELLFCGICHSDLTMVDNGYGFSLYPMVPGHEMIGRVVKTGADVSKFRPGDIAGVGCFIASCRNCAACKDGLEQYCESYPTASFSSYEPGTNSIVFGGFSSSYVVDEHFALKIPAGLDLAGAAPLLCGGITSYSALRHWNVRRGDRVGVVGLGGLGHLTVKFARAMGAHVVTFTSSEDKVTDALRLGSQEAVFSGNDAQISKYAGTLDFVVDTVSAPHDLNTGVKLLKRDGTLCLLGMPFEPVSFHSVGLGNRRRRIAGSMVGGLAETQEMLDFCGVHRIVADVEIISAHQVNTAFERLKRNDVKYRFVMDLRTLTEMDT